MARLCQKCSRDLRHPADENDNWQPDDHDNELGGHFSFHGVYGSRNDLELWKAELCERCCEDLRGWIDSGPGQGTTVVDMLDVAEEASRGQTIPGPGSPGYDSYRRRLRRIIGSLGVRRPY